MIITTTNSVEDRPVSEYLGVVVGEAVMGVNMFKDLFAGIRNIVGGRTSSYEGELLKAREAAFADIETEAQLKGADAIVGVDLDYEVLGHDGNNMLMVSISGTAVKLR